MCMTYQKDVLSRHCRNKSLVVKCYQYAQHFTSSELVAISTHKVSPAVNWLLGRHVVQQ